MIRIWNEVVRSGDAFPQMEELDEEDGAAFFGSQTACGVAQTAEDDSICGLYILHPNNVGRCGHLCNASFAVSEEARGNHIGEHLVRHCMETALGCGFRILQFNAVLETNHAARRLYERLGFRQLGTIPNGFLLPSGSYASICPYYKDLTRADSSAE